MKGRVERRRVTQTQSLLLLSLSVNEQAMSANDHQFKRRFDTLRTETHQIIEHAHSPKNDVLSAEEKRKLRQESIAKLEVKLASYISMLQALDRQMEIKHWRDMAERMESNDSE